MKPTFDEVLELCRANGFESVTEAIVAARKGQEEVLRSLAEVVLAAGGKVSVERSVFLNPFREVKLKMWNNLADDTTVFEARVEAAE